MTRSLLHSLQTDRGATNIKYNVNVIMLLLQGVLKHNDIVLYLNELYILQAVKSVLWL